MTSEFCEAPFRAAELLSGDIHDSATICVGDDDGNLVARRVGRAPADPEPGLPGMGG